MMITKRIVYLLIVLSILGGPLNAAPDKTTLLEDIKIKVLSGEEIKVFMKFSSGGVPSAKVERKDNDLKVAFDKSFADLDSENIKVNHKLLSDIRVVNINNNLNVIFKSQPDSFFTLKQKDNVYALSILAKAKLNEQNKISSKKTNTVVATAKIANEITTPLKNNFNASQASELATPAVETKPAGSTEVVKKVETATLSTTKTPSSSLTSEKKPVVAAKNAASSAPVIEKTSTVTTTKTVSPGLSAIDENNKILIKENPVLERTAAVEQTADQPNNQVTTEAAPQITTTNTVLTTQKTIKGQPQTTDKVANNDTSVAVQPTKASSTLVTDNVAGMQASNSFNPVEQLSFNTNPFPSNLLQNNDTHSKMTFMDDKYEYLLDGPFSNAFRSKQTLVNPKDKNNFEMPKKSDNNIIAAEPKQITKTVTKSVTKTVNSSPKFLQSNITGLDFKLTQDKAAKIIIGLSNANVAIEADDSKNSSNLMMFKFKNTNLPMQFNKQYDVADFATIVDRLRWVQNPSTGELILEIKNKTMADYIAYNQDRDLVIELRDKMSAEAKASMFNKTYKGKKISLNFQNIDLRSVLQIIADFTDLNLVASDSVQGNISIRLMNVPWDQALDIILKTKSLDKRDFGNIMMIAPSNEIFELERAELESNLMLEKLAKLETEYFPINYAKAEDVAALITGAGKILSDRGKASFDKRTNLLIVQDTPKKLTEIRTILNKLDAPVKQVSIEARIVRADTNFSKELGVRWGMSAKRGHDNYGLGVSDTSIRASRVLDNIDPATGTQTDGFGSVTVPSKVTSTGTTAASRDDGFNVNMGVANAAAGILGVALGKLPGSTLVHLELSALEAEGFVEAIASPKLITANKVPARIEQGQEISYNESTSSGAASTAFKKAVLSLIVTPQITPDNKIIMDLNVTNDSANFERGANVVPSINTQQVETQVLVDDGETVVLGGIYTQNITNNVSKIPFFGDLPFVGQLFRNNTARDVKTEFLIFLTPKIIPESTYGSSQKLSNVYSNVSRSGVKDGSLISYDK